MTAYRIEPFEKCHREMFGDLVLTCQTPIQGGLSLRPPVRPVIFADSGAAEMPPPENEKRRASALVDELLMDIYYSVHNGSTDYNSTSGKSHRSSWVEVVSLEEKDVVDLASILACLKDYTERMGSVLVRQLKRRDALRRQQEACCDVISRKLEERASQNKATEDMRFTIQPLKGDTGFSQWSAAMKMVAQLPGGIPQEFRSRLWLTLAERHLAAKGVNWPEVERTCFSEWSHPSDAELGVQIVKDLHRTGCSLFCGENGQENQALLKRVLLAYARWNKAVGYCQGFNMLAALILQVTERCESDALKLMIYLVEGVLPDSYFADSLRGLSVDMAVFRELLRSRLPRLSKHLDTLQNAAKDGSRSYEPPLTNVFTMQWFLTLFCNCLPQPTVLRVWDLILLEGNEILLRTALAIWQVLAERILTARSADEFYCIMGVLMRELLEFSLIDGNSLIKAVVAIGPMTELKTLRDHYLYNINPWSAASLPQTVDKQLKLYPRHALALDISSLKKQYAKLKQRQRQAHIIFSAAISRQPPTTPPVTMNHLLIGKSALVPAKRLGPPKGSIPPARQVPSTLHWKDAPKQTSSSSSSDTELCDDESAESSDEDAAGHFDNFPKDGGTDLMKNDNIHADIDIGTTSQTIETEVSINVVGSKSESDEDNFDFELFLADRVKGLKLDDPEERINCARRNSERALQIIQENSLILHRILQCQSRLTPSPPPPPPQTIDADIAPTSLCSGALALETDTTSVSTSESHKAINEEVGSLLTDLDSPEYGSRYSSILEKSKSLDEKYNALILNKPVSKTAEELSRHVHNENDVFRSSSPREKSQVFLDQYRICSDHKTNSSNVTKSDENLPVVLEETVLADTANCGTDSGVPRRDGPDENSLGGFNFFQGENILEKTTPESHIPIEFNFGESFSSCTELKEDGLEYSSKINQTILESRDPAQFHFQGDSSSLSDMFTFLDCSNIATYSDINEKSTPICAVDAQFEETNDSEVNLIDTDFKNYLFLSNEEVTNDISPDSPTSHHKGVTPLRERVFTTFNQLLNPDLEDADSGVSTLTDSGKSETNSRSKCSSQYFFAQSEAGVPDGDSQEEQGSSRGSILDELYAEQSSKTCYKYLEESKATGTSPVHTKYISEEFPMKRNDVCSDPQQKSPTTDSNTLPSETSECPYGANQTSPARLSESESFSGVGQKKPSSFDVRVWESSVSKSPKRPSLRSPLKSPLKSPGNTFNPFPVPLSSRQSKEVPLKLGLYKK